MVSIRVAFEDDEETLNKRLCDTKLTKVNAKELKIVLDFCAPSDLSQSILDYDVLEVVFTLPALILDAENYQRLDDEEIVYELDIQPQMTSE